MKKLLSIILFSGLAACGSVQAVNQGTPDTAPTSQETPISAETTFLFATDFQSAGQLLTSDESAATLTNTGVTNLGSSAVIRFFNGLLYVLHDGFSFASSDNVEVIDPQTRLIKAQWSTGNGTNPHDIVVVGSRAFISLYSPEFSKDPALADNGKPADLIVMNLSDGSIEKAFSFYDFLNDDGSRTARADQMVLVGTKLYVCLEDLEGNLFEHNAPGKLAVIDVTTLTLEKVITLSGRDPVDIVYSEEQNVLFIAHLAPYSATLGGFDTSDPYSGLEIVPLDAPQNAVLIQDKDLGGYVERLALGNGKLLVVVSNFDEGSFQFTSEILSMDLSNTTAAGLKPFITGSADVRDMAVDSQSRLWIARRSIAANTGKASDPQVDVIDLPTGKAVGDSLIPPVPVTSIVFGSF